MLTIEQLKQVVHKRELTKTNVALLCVAAGGGAGVFTRRVRQIASEAGIKRAKKINFSALLSSAKDKVFKTPNGWELTEAGQRCVSELAGTTVRPTSVAEQASKLRALLPKVKKDDARSFIEEAIACAEYSLFRSAVVLSWVGAMFLLYHAAAKSYLDAVNTEAARRVRGWKPAKSAADLCCLKESVFLDIAETIGLINKNVKQELDTCLRLRNACAHPSSLKIGAARVASHLETLLLNVYAEHAAVT